MERPETHVPFRGMPVIGRGDLGMPDEKGDQTMRVVAVIVLLSVVAGCAPTISSTPYKPGDTGGTPYRLPKGLVPVQVFADQNGIGITIEPARTAIDSEPGILVARLDPSGFNNEDIKIAADPATGFLTAISSESEAQLLAIVEEAANSAARLAFQNSRAAFLQKKVVVFEDSFDPLRPEDVERINRGINSAISVATGAFLNAKLHRLEMDVLAVRLVVDHPNGVPADSGPVPELDTTMCNTGICVRTMTSRIIRIVVGGAPFAGKLVNIPARELIPVPVPSTVFANQNITIGVTGGILDKYELERDSEVLGVVKIPGAILNGIVAGLTQGLTDEKSIIDARKDVATSEEALAKAEKSRNEAVASRGTTSTALHSSTAGGVAGDTDYAAATLTIYPFSDALSRAIDEAIEAAKKTGGPNTGGGSDLVVPTNPN
jgi:hypothetical protein